MSGTPKFLDDGARPKDPRLAIPEFREAHKIVCKIYHEIDHTKWKRLPALKAAAADGDVEASNLLLRYEEAMAKRKATTAKGAN